MKNNSMLKPVRLSEKEALFICNFIDHIEEHMPWAYEFFNVDHRTLVDLGDRIYRVTDTYRINLEEEMQLSESAITEIEVAN